MKQKKLKLLGTNKLIKKQSLAKYVYQSLPWHLKFRRNIDEKHIANHLTVHHLIYHPFWVAKTLVIADRKPFPPKKSPNMIFVDAVSYYRGLFTNIPELTETIIKTPQTIIKADLKRNEVIHYIKDVQISQINRTYLLKKPKHKIVDYFLVYLPLWYVTLNSPYRQETLYINANTGEVEDHLSKLWRSSRKLTL